LIGNSHLFEVGGAITNDVFSNRGKNSFQICIFEIGQFGKISYKIGQERPDNNYHVTIFDLFHTMYKL
jgi:hypothetical protein